MHERLKKKRSKFLSLVLRHRPERANLTLDEGGWVCVDALLAGCRAAGQAMTGEELEEVVATNQKQRFVISADGTRIRANQGHSVDVDLGLKPQTPPATLFHGTVEGALPAIRSAGLERMRRHHVHLSADTTTAEVVGARRGKAVVLSIDATAMQRAGHLFYCTANGVWLTDSVPPEFIRTTGDKRP